MFETPSIQKKIAEIKIADNDRPPPPLPRPRTNHPLGQSPTPLATKSFFKRPQTIRGQWQGSKNQCKGWWNRGSPLSAVERM